MSYYNIIAQNESEISYQHFSDYSYSVIEDEIYSPSETSGTVFTA
jgi:hypothetical protein